VILMMVLNFDDYAGFFLIWRILLDFGDFEDDAGCSWF